MADISQIKANNKQGVQTSYTIKARALSSNAGSATQPVYFANGVPVATTYTLGKSVPANAVFTDTWRPAETVLTNQDLNTITTPGFYSAGGGNTVTNKPSGVDAFGMTVVHKAAGTYYTQTLYVSTDALSYRRICNNGTWGSWMKEYLTDTNTWRGIQNNLTSDSTTESLSAAQGKALKTAVDGKISRSGDTMKGTLFFGESGVDTKSAYITYSKTYGLQFLNQGAQVCASDAGTITLTNAPGSSITMDGYNVTCTGASSASSSVTRNFNIDFDRLNVTGQIYSSNSIYLANTKYVRGANKSGTYNDILGVSADNACYVGIGAYSTVLRGSSVRLQSTSGQAVTSDRNLKEEISSLDAKYENFFDNLKPVNYKYKFGTSGRNHVGFIAQDVEDALAAADLTTKQFGGIDINYIDSSNREVTEDEEGNAVDVKNSQVNYLLDNGIDKEYELKYEEFIALAIDQIQKLKKRVDSLEAQLKSKEE